MSRPGRAVKLPPCLHYLVLRLLLPALAFLFAAAAPSEAGAAESIAWKDWERAAAALERARESVQDPGLLEACLLALRDIAAHEAEYAETRRIIPNFVDEAESTVRYINRATPEDALMMPDYALGLFECSALMVRAACLSKPAGECRPEQRRIMEFFEKSGHWLPADESAVSDYYYSALPSRMK